LAAVCAFLLAHLFREAFVCLGRNQRLTAGCLAGQRHAANRLLRWSLQVRLKRDEFKLNPFEVLGVEAGTGEKDIKKQYRQMARKMHPDVSKAPDAKERWLEVTWAYNLLMDPEELAIWEEKEAQAEVDWVRKERVYDQEVRASPKTPWEAYMRREERKLAKQLSEEERDMIKRRKWWREKAAIFKKAQMEAKEREETGKAVYIPAFAFLVPPVLAGIAFTISRVG